MTGVFIKLFLCYNVCVMADYKVRGIVLKTSDYKDNDKIIKLYSLEQGKINAVMRGVKKAKAKMKIAAQVFCFGEYVLLGSGDFPVVTGSAVEESFFSLCTDPDKFSAAAAVIELTEKAVPPFESNPQIFLLLLKTMNELLKVSAESENVRARCRLILLSFMLKLFGLSGFKIKFDKCCVCGGDFFGPRAFDFIAGGAACKRCAGYNSAPVTPLCCGIMAAANNCDTDRLDTLAMDEAGVEEGIALCKTLSERVFECRLLSLN